MLFALMATLYQAYQGVMFSWDSDHYLIMANKFAHFFNSERPAEYAPLYPLTLGALQFMGLKAIHAIQVVWFISYFLIAGSAYIISRSAIISAFAILFLFATDATAYFFRYAWTEIGYAALLTTAAAALFIHISDTKNKRSLFVFLVALTLLPVQRYIGGFMALFLGLVFIGFSTDRAMVLRRAGMTVLATLPTVLTLIQNHGTSGHFAGARPPATSGMVQNAELTWSTLEQFFRGEVVLIALTIGLAIFLALRRKHQSRRVFLALMLALLPIAQILFQILSSSLTGIEPINVRFFIVLAPVVFLNIVIIGSVWARAHPWHLIMATALALCINGFVGPSPRAPQPRINALPLQKYLASLPTSEIAVFADETRHLWADKILTQDILPPSHCRSYLAIGDFRTSAAQFTPDCETLQGHTFRPVINFDEAAAYPVVLIQPHGNVNGLLGSLIANGYGIKRFDRIIVMQLAP